MRLLVANQQLLILTLCSLLQLARLRVQGAHLAEDELERFKRQAASSPTKATKPKGSWEQECLAAHNKWRRLHNAPELVFDKKIAQFSQKRADHISRSDGAEFRHPDDLVYGENLAWHSRPTTSCSDLIKMWYDEVELYDFSRAAFSHETGHFTQLVWKESKAVGCAKSIGSGPKGGVYLVCNYDPPGNFLGEASSNVKQRSQQVPGGELAGTSSTTKAPAFSTSTTPTPSLSSSSSSPSSTTTTTKGPKKKTKKQKNKSTESSTSKPPLVSTARASRPEVNSSTVAPSTARKASEGKSKEKEKKAEKKNKKNKKKKGKGKNKRGKNKTKKKRPKGPTTTTTTVTTTTKISQPPED